QGLPRQGQAGLRGPLGAAMDAFEGHSFSKGAVIVHEGTRADAAYVVEKGSVVVFRTVNGRELMIARLEKGAIFGEMALIERRKHKASVRAAEDCTCAVVTEKRSEEPRV